MRHSRRSSGRAVIATLPWIAALAFNCLMIDAAELFGGIAAEKVSQRVAEPMPLAADSEPSTVSLPSSGVDSDSAFWTPHARDRPARDRPVDVGVLEGNLADGIVRLAADVARRRAVEARRAARRSEMEMGAQDFGIARRRAGSGGNFASTGF